MRGEIIIFIIGVIVGILVAKYILPMIGITI
jgi:hypothetical protein